MEQNNLESMKMLNISSLSTNTASSKSMIPRLETEKKAKLQKLFTALTLLLVLVTLVWLAQSAFYLFKLQQDIDKLKQVNNNSIQVNRQIAEVEKINTLMKHAKCAAHLTGRAFTQGSKTLMWEDVKGFAFTQQIHYQDEALIIRESGLYFIYSKILFRELNCVRDRLLHQIVFKRSVSYPKALPLMIMKKSNHCSMNRGHWDENNYQAGIFELEKGEYIYVNVSHPDLVHFGEPYTFFGLYQL